MAALVREIRLTLLIGHSIGAALAAKVMELASEQVTGLISVAPGPHGNVKGNRPPLPDDRAITFNEDSMPSDFSATRHAFQKIQSINIGVRFAR